MRWNRGAWALLVGATGAALAGPALAQKPFEGTIDAKVNTQMGGADVTYSIKGDKLRMDMSMGQGLRSAMIVDATARKTYMLMPTRQMYLVRDIPDSLPTSAQEAGGDTFAWTGRMETIAGLPCEHATVTAGDGSKLDMCIAKGITYFGRSGAMGGRRVPGANGWQQHVQGGFPLRVQHEGDAVPLFEATKVERKALGDSLFAPPSGWQKMAVPMLGVPMGRP